MRPLALVTGATGMLGSYIVDELLAEGRRVRAFVRDRGRASFLAARGVELASGSLDDGASVVVAARGCDVLFHAAAEIGSGDAWERFRSGNVEGTANVVEAACAHGARLVHVSSTAVFGAARYRDTPTDERVPLPELPQHDAYGRSKQAAERIVLGAHAAGRLQATVVRPPVMYGRRDRQFVPRVGPVLRRGAFPLIDGGRTTLTLVHAGSVARGAVLAARTDRAAGRVYHLTNDFPVDTRTLVRCAEEGLGVRVRGVHVPRAAGRAGFAGLALALRMVGRGDLARHAGGTLDMLTRNNPFSSARARAELGWSPDVPPETALTEAFRWWREHGERNTGEAR
jgi:nucleoside-diphosphate-sugar epimerase